MRYRAILLEYNVDFLINSYSTQYEKMKQEDGSNPHKSLQEFISTLDSITRENNSFQILQPYFKWIVFKYVSGNLNKYEDILSKVLPYLLKYDALKRKNKLKPEHKDVNQIKNISILMDIVDSYDEVQSKQEERSEAEQQLYKNKEATLVYNDTNIKVVIPHTEKASCYFGKNTRWCTAAINGNNAFDEYEDGELYIILIKKENKRFQFHFETEQFMNERDEQIDVNKLADQYPLLWEIFAPIAESKNSLVLNKNLSYETKKYLVIHNPHLFEKIYNPSLELAFIALKGGAIDVSHIFKNYKLSTTDLENLIMIYPVILKQKKYEQFTAQIPETALIKLVTKKPHNIEYIKSPSEELQLIAINHEPHLIRYIDIPTLKVKEEVIKKIPSLITDISKPTVALVNLAIDTILEQHGDDITSKKTFDSSGIKRIIRKYPQKIGYILGKNPKLFRRIVEFYYTARSIFHSAPEIPPSIQLLAVKYNKNNIKYIPEPSPAVVKFLNL